MNYYCCKLSGESIVITPAEVHPICQTERTLPNKTHPWATKPRAGLIVYYYPTSGISEMNNSRDIQHPESFWMLNIHVVVMFFMFYLIFNGFRKPHFSRELSSRRYHYAALSDVIFWLMATSNAHS